jgi:uncharacterized membrane protein YeiH
MEILGTFAFASSGTTRAIKKHYDLFGLLVLGFVTAIGGGTLRDVLLGRTPVAWLDNITLISVIIFGSITTYIFYSYMNKLRWWVFFFDAVGLGLFTISGIQIGLSLEYSVVIVLIIGVLSGSFGGLLRDILSGEKPLLLRNEIYATASIGGGVIFLAGTRFTSIDAFFWEVVSVVFIVVLRVLSFKYGWSLQLPIKDSDEN